MIRKLGWRLPYAISWAAGMGLVAACGGRSGGARGGGDAPGGGDSSAATAAADSGRWERVGVARGFEGPESARYDADLDLWFVSNVNGEAGASDGNGYISRLKPDGSPDSIKFIVGGRRGVTLNAPKGLAIVGDTVWVADIDVARAFNKRTGAPVATVSLAGKAKFLNGAAAGPDGVYMTDTGVGKDMQHTGPDRIYRIAGRKAAVALETESLSAPNGIVWDPARRRFIVVPFGGTGIVTWAPGETTTRPLGTGPGMQDGVLPLDSSRVLITSWTDSSLFVLANGRPTTVARDLPSPADIDMDPATRIVAVPLLLENRVDFWRAP